MNTSLLLLNTMLAGNVVLVHLFGVHAQIAFSKRLDVACWMALIMFCMLSISMPICYLLHRLLLVPLALTHLQIIFYLLVNYICALAIYQIIDWLNPLMRQLTAVTMPLVIGNSLLLGNILLGLSQLSWWHASIFGIASGSGFALLLLTITMLRERLQQAQVPNAFQGLPILLMTLAIMSMAYSGFSLSPG